jgi:hypothetical protein
MSEQSSQHLRRSSAPQQIQDHARRASAGCRRPRALRLLSAEFVELEEQHERQAILALAELLASELSEDGA